MENRIQVFSSQCFGEVRVKIIDGEPWLVGKDVCAAFGGTNYSRSLRRLDADEKSVSQNSELVEARIRLLNKFRRWISHDVIPCICKYGCYITPKKLKEIENEPDEFYREIMIELAKRRATQAWMVPDQEVKEISNRVIGKNRPTYKYLTKEAMDTDDESFWDSGNE